jgi:PAS domain S-box-containing protein
MALTMSKVPHKSPGEQSEHFERHGVDYKTLFDIAPLGLVVYSKGGQALEANRSLLNMLGHESSEAGKQISLFDSENLKEFEILDFLAGALEGGTLRQMETSYTSESGQTSVLDIVAVPLVENDEIPERAVAFVQDVTAQKKIRDHLLSSEIRFRLLADKTPLGIAIVDHEGRIEYKNPVCTSLFSGTTEEISTLEECLDRVIPDVASRDMVATIVRGQKDQKVGEPEQQCVTVISRDGSSRNVRFRAFSLDGEKRVVICEDSTEMVRALEARRASEQKYVGLLENLTDVVYCLDVDGTLLSVNGSAARLLGYEPAEVIGQNIGQVIPESARKHIPTSLQKVLQEGVAQGVSKYRAKDGSTLYLEYSSTLIKPVDQPPYVVGVARDVTDRTRRDHLSRLGWMYTIL